MADNNAITSPLLSSDHLIITVDSDSAPPAASSPNPFRAVGCDAEELTVPPAITVDPFRNDKARIKGVYDWVRTLVCVPLMLARLVLFGLCLAVGYVATKLALYGWKDKENPMPVWRCRVMWVTRICARCILFAFG